MPKKIFELAKELDMGALDLVEKLKDQGFNVRNHMNSLTDEEVEKAMASFAEMSAVSDPKKKATKKKVVKKKVVKKSTKAGDSKKKTATIKKTVLRKKGDEGEAPTEIAASEEVSETKVIKKKVVKKKAAASAEEVSGENPEGNKSETLEEAFGLRVVSRPEVKAKEVAPPENVDEESEEEELYKEKIHTFTPVFIPEKKEATAETKSTETTAEGDEDSDSDKKEKDSKKRLGGLATMMSGKKVGSKSQVLNQVRADTELKSYAALSGTGRPIYTQVKRKKTFSGPTKGTEITELKESKRVVKVHNGTTALDLAKKLKVKFKDMVNDCLKLNLLIKQEDFLGNELASEIATMYDYKLEDVSFNEDEVLGKTSLSDEAIEKLPLRNPIITIMGHVDHGKTTLLDYIRNAKVAQGEAGGITQHIGAYSVQTKSGKQLTFLDTPGHAAFASMRQRGATVTDIVILVVAADDGVMPQTRESVRFVQEANVPLIVAINKMDKEGVNPDRVKNELTEFGISPEEWGGETQMVPISALKGDGVDDLLEAVALQAEMMELRADPKGKAEGVTIESKVEPGRGPVATVLIQTGTLKKGDSVVVGECFGRARSLVDHLGNELKEAGPSMPVQILGLNEAPSPGDNLNIVKNEREAKKIIQNRVDERKKIESMPKKSTVSLEDFFAQAPSEAGEVKTLNIITRSDVQGSFEAIKSSLETLSNSEVEVRVLGGGVGPISDSDVQLADASGAIIMGFNMRPSTSARRLAEDKGVEVRTYSIIYQLIDDVKAALEGMLDPEFIEKYIGRVEVKETFVVPKVGTIAGSVVIDGSIKVGCQVRLLRDGKIVFDGKMSSLKRFKDDVKEVKSGYECGVGLDGFNDVKVGDLFEAYIMEEKKRSLEDVTKMDAQKANTEVTENHL
ncbi:MAG: translation initiation factor IF-2 [Bacteriovoracaceae bacterium]|nr:translation initiation factor IF-2 [Bacteriovoracaceae bacterium]